MRTIIALAVIAATFALGGCFHHNQQTYRGMGRSAPPPPNGPEPVPCRAEDKSIA
jgi:hypothetical protein